MNVTCDNGSALIVVDIQNDFCPGGSLAVRGGDEIIPSINSLMGGFNLVVASQDWHPAGHISFASAHEGKKPFDTVELMGEEQILWPDHCVSGTRGAEFHKDLDVRPIVLVVRKGWHANVDSYSVFFENDHVTPTGLEPYLRGLGVRRIFIVGLALDFCVYYSAKDALRRGFETRIIADASRGIDQPPGTLDRKMREIAVAGAVFVKAADLLRSVQ
jgi:nicotinamidase/pyrazinamidase